MSVALALPLFAVSLTVTLAAARLFARRLDVLGVRFGLPEALVGLLTALAADGPEISSAVISLARGERAVSVGVLVGSNVFNLAAMIGLSVCQQHDQSDRRRARAGAVRRGDQSAGHRKAQPGVACDDNARLHLRPVAARRVGPTRWRGAAFAVWRVRDSPDHRVMI